MLQCWTLTHFGKVLCYTVAFQQSTSGNGLAVPLVISFPHTVLFTYLLLFSCVVSLCRLNRLHVRSYLRPMYFFFLHTVHAHYCSWLCNTSMNNISSTSKCTQRESRSNCTFSDSLNVIIVLESYPSFFTYHSRPFLLKSWNKLKQVKIQFNVCL